MGYALLNLLHQFSTWLEEASNRHSHTISLLEALATTAAVIVALTASYAAKRATRPQLVAKLSVMQVIYGVGGPISEIPAYIAVQLTNTGSVPIKLTSTFFSWRFPFEKQVWLARPIDEIGDEHVRRVYPCTILPNTSETFFLTSMAIFKTTMPGVLAAGRFGRKMSARLLRGVVYANDGSQFRASFESSFQKELLTLLGMPVAPAKDG